MMRPKMMVHGSLARCICDPAEQERLLSMGWLFGVAKAKTADAKRMRLSRERRRSEGWLQLELWIPPDVIEALKSARLPSESYGALLVRLIKERGSSDENPLSHIQQ